MEYLFDVLIDYASFEEAHLLSCNIHSFLQKVNALQNLFEEL